MLSPKKELEAWALCDHAAVKAALGVKAIPGNFMPETPEAAERIADPKANFNGIINLTAVKKGANRQILVRIAQEQSLEKLRQMESFREFELSLHEALNHCGFMR